MRKCTSMQYLLVFLILVDQILNAPASKHAKKKKHGDSNAHKVTEIDDNLHDETERHSSESITHEEHKHKIKKHHKTHVSNTSHHKHSLRHRFSKLTGESHNNLNETHHKSALRSPDTHKHETKHHSHKKSRHKTKHRAEHVDADVKSNEDSAFKRVTKLDIEEPIKHESHEKKQHKKHESSDTKSRDSNSQSKNDRVDSKYDSNEVWKPDSDIENEDTLSESKEASITDIKIHADKEPSHSRQERKHHTNKNKKLPFYVSSSMATTGTNGKDHLKIILHKSGTEIRSHANVKENETAPLVKEIVHLFKDKNVDLKNKKIDVNATLNSLASSKLLDIITDKVANQMMNRLKKRIKENALRTHDFGATEAQAVEQIEIVFRNDDDMVE